MKIALAGGRLVLLGLALASLYLCSWILSVGQGKSEGKDERLCRWKARVAQLHMGWLLKISGFRLHIEGQLPPVNSRFLLLANHVSYWDVVALASLFPLGFIAKEEVKSWLFLGGMASRLNTVFVRREKPLSRVQALFELKKKSRKLAYCIFPEGTTTNHPLPSLAHWYRGQIALAEKPGMEVYLAGLHYHEHQRMAWIDDDSFVPHLLRVLCRPRSDLFLSFRPLQRQEAERSGLWELSQQAFEQTAEACRQVLSRADHVYG